MRPAVSLPSLASPPSTAGRQRRNDRGKSTAPVLSSKAVNLQLEEEDDDEEEQQEDESPRRLRGGYAARFSAQSKRSLVRCDVSPLLARFEDAALFQDPHRKPLTVVLHEISDAQQRRRSLLDAITATSSVVEPSKPPLDLLQRQATALVLRRRSRARQQQQDRRALTAGSPSTPSNATATAIDSDATAIMNQRQRAALPSRVLFDASRWPRSSRCDYCQRAGGDLECATCDVIAHAPCFLSDFGARAHKQKAAFVVPSRFSWLCRHCQRGLQAEYDARAALARSQQLSQQRLALGRVVMAYLRMAKDARLFARKKLAAVKIQAFVRGRLARWHFLRTQRNRVRPYTLDALRVFAQVTDSSGSGEGDCVEELRLANGFSCNPYLHVAVCDGEDDSLQLLSFELSLRKGLSLSLAAVDGSPLAERLLVPGMDGNASLAFTLLSKNGPKSFFLGQAVLRLLDERDAVWRDGAEVDLELRERVEIPPKTAQKQPLRLAHPVDSASAGGSGSVWASRVKPRPKFVNGDDECRADGPRLRLSLALRPLRDAQSHCGYMGLKTALDALHTHQRWCVLADSALRVYRHYGVTVASETVDMARAIDVRLERGPSSRAAATERRTRTRTRMRMNGSERTPNCVVVEHVTRLFVFECEHGEAARRWHKKLQAAQRSVSSGAATSATCETVGPSTVTLGDVDPAAAGISRA